MSETTERTEPTKEFIFCIGRIDGLLTVETRRWVWKPRQPFLARRSRRTGKMQLLYYRDDGMRALRMPRDQWLTRYGISPYKPWLELHHA
jgi:hypothetical protein